MHSAEVPKGGVRNEDRGESRIVGDLINSHGLVDFMFQLSKCQMFVCLSMVTRTSLSNSGIGLLGCQIDILVAGRQSVGA
jgi:hypothetical protein